MFETEEEVQKVFTPKLIKDKLVVPKFKKDGSLSRVGLTPQEYDDCVSKPFYRKKLQTFNLGSRKQIGEYLQTLVGSLKSLHLYRTTDSR